MAREYGRIKCRWWTDVRIRDLPISVKAVGAYLMTCEHSTALGAYRLTAAYVSDDMGISVEEARAYLAQLEAVGFIAICPRTNWIWLKRYLRHNRPENGNVWKHVDGLIAGMPTEVSFREELLAEVEAVRKDFASVSNDPAFCSEPPLPTPPKPSGNGSETVSKQEPYPEPNQNLTSPNLPASAREDGFEAVSEAYPHPPGSSPVKDREAWDATAERRPETPLLVACVEAYARSIAAQNAKRGDDPVRVPQLATWLRGECWTRLLDEAKATAAKAGASESARLEKIPPEWREAAAKLDSKLLDALLVVARLLPGGLVEFSAQFGLDQAEKHGWLPKISDALGYPVAYGVKGRPVLREASAEPADPLALPAFLDRRKAAA